MNQEKLNEIVRLHGLWMRGAEGGVRADLSGANLADADLRRTDLAGANLRGADLRDANLRGAVLRRAYLAGADLADADLADADLVRADLVDANLAGAAGAPPYFSISWGGHGERGRRMHAVQVEGVLRFSCGCFEGDEQTLRLYIEDGDERYRQSRLKALEIILELARMEGTR